MCLHQSFSKTQAFHRHRSTDGHQWEVSLPIVDFSQELLQKKQHKNERVWPIHITN